MTARLGLLLRKEDLVPQGLEERVVVVVDVLLATTAIAYALSQGVRRVLPAAGPEAARVVLRDAGREGAVLAGESLGRSIPGFAPIDPRRWPEQVRKGGALVLTSTNGCVALSGAWGAGDLYAGALVNAGAVAADLAARHGGEDVLLVCAGSGGRASFDDILAAGCLVDRLEGHERRRLGDGALAARGAYRAHRGEIAEGLALSRTGRWFIEEGWGDLLAFAAALDRWPAVPRREGGWLVRADAPYAEGEAPGGGFQGAEVEG